MTEALARCLEILLGIDAGRRGVDLGNGDLHPGLERAKLFETFLVSRGDGGRDTGAASASRRHP